MARFLAIAALLGSALAQRPSNVSICDYYTTALLKENNATNQKTLLTLVVNTAVIGNYTQPNVGISVPGILANGTYNGTQVSLLPYFDGMLASTNMGGKSGVSQSFLDGGGAAPLMMDMPANDTTSHQYMLLTHLYSYFGVLLGCSMVGKGSYPAYTGDKSMYDVHKYMGLGAFEFGYFIEQVGLAAASFGVADADVEAVGTALNSLFGYKCAPAAAVVPSQGDALQAICIESNCPTAPSAACAAYGAAPAEPSTVVPGSATATGSMSSGTGSATSTSGSSATGSMSGSATAASSTGMATNFGPAAAVDRKSVV